MYNTILYYNVYYYYVVFLKVLNVNLFDIFCFIIKLEQICVCFELFHNEYNLLVHPTCSEMLLLLQIVINLFSTISFIKIKNATDH